MTETAKSLDYTKNILQTIPNTIQWKWSLKPMPSSLRLTA